MPNKDQYLIYIKQAAKDGLFVFGQRSEDKPELQIPVTEMGKNWDGLNKHQDSQISKRDSKEKVHSLTNKNKQPVEPPQEKWVKL